MRRRGGFIMVLALVYVFVLTVIVTAMAYFIAYETRGIGFQLDDTKALYLAQAGAERGFREIRDEVITPPQTGTADLRGGDTSLSSASGISNAARMSYIDGSSATLSTGTAIIRTFDSNYTQTQIISVFLFVRASRATGGTGATIAVSYTTNGSVYTTAFTQALPNTTTLANYSAGIPGLTWTTLMSPNFRLRVIRTAGNRNVNIDAIWLRVTYNIDTNTEPWYTGTYATFPITLGDGTIKTTTIVDEARKVHLNYASQSLLSNLLTNLGITNANAKAAAIVNYRGAALTNPFDTVEELQQVAGITSTDYAVIKDYVTVYSYINQNSYNSHAIGSAPVARAPVNINTAPFQVLKAIFDPLALSAGDSTRLANDIITFRNPATGPGPFTCFYSYTAVPTDFIDFVNNRSYLTTTEKRTVIDNADSSLLAPVSGFINATQTTEFCYANTAYRIESVGSIAVPAGTGTAKYINLRAAEIVGNDGSRTFPVYANQPQAAWKGYWKESYE